MSLISFPTRDAQADRTQPPKPNLFERDQSWLAFLFAFVMAILAIASGFASFNGIQLFLGEVGGDSIVTKGTSVILTLSIVTILGVGWSLILRYGPEIPTTMLRARMLVLGLSLTVLTFGASTTSNLAALVGPPSKVYAWQIAHTEGVALTNQLETNVLGIDKILPGWRAQQAESCALADLELNGGVASGTGAGNGPVAANLARVCEQTTSFVGSMDQAKADAQTGIRQATAALRAMQIAIRDRDTSLVSREDRYLDAGVALNGALQQIRAADLTDVMDAGAAQLKASVAELTENTAFSARQAESVAGIKAGLSGLVASTELITARLAAAPIPPHAPVTSPDLISAVKEHGLRFLPMVSIAVAIDLFPLWALIFLMTLRASGARLANTARTSPNR